MKKRILAIAFVAALAAACLLSLIACDLNGGNENTSDGLVYEKKYIYESDVHSPIEEQSYYIFHKNGECEYRCTREETDYQWIMSGGVYTEKVEVGTAKIDYTINYRYTYADNDKSAIVYFYNGVTDNSTYTDKQGKVTPLKDAEWSKNNDEYLPEDNDSDLLTVSNNVLCRAGSFGYVFYVNEDFVKSIPDFNPHETSED